MNTELITAAQQAAKEADFKKASMLYEEVLSKDPDNIKALMGLGYTKHSTGQFSQALSALHKAIELDPHNAEAHFLLGGVYYWQKEYREAEKYQRQAVTLAPAVARYRLGLAADLTKLSEPELALTQLETAYRLNPQILNPHGKWQLWRARILTGLQPVSWLAGWVFIGAVFTVGGVYGLNQILSWIGRYISFVSVQQNQILLRAVLMAVPFIVTCVYQVRRRRYRRALWALMFLVLWGWIVWYIPHRVGLW